MCATCDQTPRLGWRPFDIAELTLRELHPLSPSFAPSNPPSLPPVFSHCFSFFLSFLPATKLSHFSTVTARFSQHSEIKMSRFSVNMNRFEVGCNWGAWGIGVREVACRTYVVCVEGVAGGGVVQSHCTKTLCIMAKVSTMARQDRG